MTTPRSRAEPTAATVDDKTVLVPHEQVDCVIVIAVFKEPIVGSLKYMMAEIRHLANRHDVIFYAEGGPISIKLSLNFSLRFSSFLTRHNDSISGKKYPLWGS